MKSATEVQPCRGNGVRFGLGRAKSPRGGIDAAGRGGGNHHDRRGLWAAGNLIDIAMRLARRRPLPLVEGRRQHTGKRSRRVLRPILFAPEPRRHFPRRDAERQFVTRLSDVWRNVAGVAPSRTARWGPTRDLGPFASFVSECLRLVGAGDADAVELINELHRGRRVKARPE
jgi:hypothetical protein